MHNVSDRYAAEMPVSSPSPSRNRPIHLLLLLGLSVILYLGTSFYPPLLDDADAAHAVVARAMLQRGDWAVMFMDGIRYLMKAPLHYWMVAAGYAVFGQYSEFATRLPVALAMIGLVLLVYEFGRRFFDERTGLCGALVIGTSVGCFIFTRIMIPEAIYALQFTAAFYLFLRAWTRSLSPRVGYWGAAVMIALAVLTRGLIGVVFPVGAIVAFILLVRGWRRWRELHLFSSTAIFAAIAAPWHLLAEYRAPGFFWAYFVNEHVNRALGTRYPPDYSAVPLWIWWTAHLAWFFPWAVFLPLAVREVLRTRVSELDLAGQARLLLVVWSGEILIFFSLIGGSRMEYYSFGAWPAIAILIGLGISEAEERHDRWLPRLYATLSAVGVIVLGVLGYLVWQSSRVRPAGDISGLLQSHPKDFYRVSMAHILDLTPAAFADLRVPALIAGFSMAIAFTAAWLLRRRGHSTGAALSIATGMVGFFFAANMAYGVFGVHMSSHALVVEMQKYLRPEDEVAIYGEFDPGSSVAFYTGRQVLLYNGATNNNLEFGSNYPDAPHIFLNDAEFAALWRGSRRVFLFVPEEEQDAARVRLPPDATWVFDQLGGKTVYVNHPLRPDLPTLAQSEARPG